MRLGVCFSSGKLRKWLKFIKFPCKFPVKQGKLWRLVSLRLYPPPTTLARTWHQTVYIDKPLIFAGFKCHDFTHFPSKFLKPINRELNRDNRVAYFNNRDFSKHEAKKLSFRIKLIYSAATSNGSRRPRIRRALVFIIFPAQVGKYLIKPREARNSKPSPITLLPRRYSLPFS